MTLQIRKTNTGRVRRGAGLDTPSALIGAVLGGVGVYIGTLARRRRAAERSLAALRHGRRRLDRRVRVAAAFARGRARGVAHRFSHRSAAALDDTTLAHKVESILFRDPQVPKGRLSINAENGTVFLRGEIEDRNLIEELEQAVRAITGVQSVENLLHLPGTPAPHPSGGASMHRRTVR